MISVIKDGKNLQLFDTITVRTSLDSLCGTFSLTTSLKITGPLNLGDLLQFKVKDENAQDIPLVKGYIEKSNGVITKDTATVDYGGRDLLGDLVDSSVPPELGLTEGGISLPALCDKVLKGLKISAEVINQAGTIKPFSQTEIAAIGFGGKAGAFLQRFARKRHLFLNTDGLGNLVIFSPPTALGYKDKLTKDSITLREFSYSDLDRFNTIEVGSEDNFAQKTVANPDSAHDRRSTFSDPEVRESRYLQVHAEESMSDFELEGKAQEEVNIRRAQAFNFSCTVPSHNYEKGKLIKVEDELSGVYGTLLIREVEYKTGKSNTSKLTLCFPETYTGIGARVTANKAKIGDKPPVEEPRLSRSIFGFLEHGQQ